MKITTSKIFTLNRLDLGKGLLIAVITGVFGTCGTIIEAWIKSPVITIDHNDVILILKASFAAGSSYLFKNWLSPSKIIVKEVPEQIINEIQDANVVKTTTTETTETTTNEPK